MPTRKQRRRREKGRRHEYEYVYVDEEGREVEVEEPDEPAAAKKSDPTQPRARGGARGGRPPRKVEPPSWRRVVRRGAIFAPIMLVVVYLLRPKGSGAVHVLYQTVILMAFFLPFSYLMDSIMYRSYRKRIGDDGGDAKRR